jgi:hypothetical protein
MVIYDHEFHNFYILDIKLLKTIEDYEPCSYKLLERVIYFHDLKFRHCKERMEIHNLDFSIKALTFATISTHERIFIILHIKIK